MNDESLMPERDEIWAKHDGLTPELAAEMLAFAGTMEMERNVWKHDAGKLRDELEKADEALEANISTFIDLREAAITLLKERDNALSDFRQADTDSIRALHERNTARIQRDEAEDQLANERAISDQLAAIVQRSRDGHGGMLTDPECFCEDCEHLRVLDAALNAWKEARK